MLPLTRPRIDVPSIALSTLGFGGLLYGFSVAGSQGWSAPEVLFTLAVMITIMVFMSMFSAMLLVPLYLQKERGFTPFASGFLVMPGAILMGIMSPIAGKIFDKVGARLLGVVGSVVLVVALARLAGLSHTCL